MRALLMLVLALPTASAWAVEIRAPDVALEGAPFAVEVCGAAPGRGQVRILAENASLDVREDRYLAAFEGAACRSVEVARASGRVEIEARLRADGGGAVHARAYANVTVERAPGALRVVDVWAPPLAGIVVRNDGNETAPLSLRALNGIRLPNATLAPHGSIFLGERAPPGFEGIHVELRARVGPLRLTVGDRVESEIIVPKLRDGASLVGRYGRTDLDARAFAVEGEILAYAMPGATPLPDMIDRAQDEVLVVAHTLTSADLAAALARASDRGARVRVLLEGAPPGGVPPDERALAATLQARGVEVLVMGGEGARYRTMHAKLVVVDRAILAIGTENFNEGSSRGFGLVIEDLDFASALADVMDADAAPWHDIAPAAFGDAPADALAAFPAVPDARAFAGPRNVTLVLSPDDPRALAEAVALARASLDVAMLRAEPASAMVNATIEAARAGARVRVLLDGRFDDGTNRETAARLAALAAREGLALEAKLDRADRTLHAKMFVVDARVSYVGSMNWVQAAWSENREAGVLVDDAALAQWLGEEFEKDWRGDPEVVEVPDAGMLSLLSLIVTLAALSRRPRPRAPSRRA